MCGLRRGLGNGIRVSFWCFFKGSFDFLVEGAGEEWSLFRKGSSADPPPVQQRKGERQAISGQELTLVATSAFLRGTAGHVGEAELP